MAATVDHNTLAEVLNEIQEQPAWRSQADREMDYRDGNQLSSTKLQALKEKGMEPCVENDLGPIMEDITGMEAKNRTDWRTEPDGDKDPEADAVAKATGYLLNRAERRSGADRALTKAYDSLACVGIGWVEVARESDPFKYQYKVDNVHRNEMWRDWYSRKDDLSDCRWVLRRRWSHVDPVMLAWPAKKALIQQSIGGYGSADDLALITMEDSHDTDSLNFSFDIERSWTIEESEWRDPNSKRVCLFQLQTRNYRKILVLRMSNGRVVEFKRNDPLHQMAVSSGMKVQTAMTSDIKNTFFLGPHVLSSGDGDFNTFNFVQVVGRLEDRTRVPYGTLRWLMPLQDEINARVTKMNWMLGATRTERTKGAVLMTDEVFRHEVGRADADIILDQKHMGIPGAVFKIDSNMELNRQQYERLLDLRERLRYVSGVSAALSGDVDPDNSGAISQAIEQSIQGLATLNDNFAYARQQVGQLLLQLIVKDIGESEYQVTIEGNSIKDDEIVVLNQPTYDDETGQHYRTNDIQRTMLKVEISDVKSTPTFQQQQLLSLTEVMKSAADDIKAVLMPYYLSLTNIPDKEDIVAEIRNITAGAQITQEQAQQMVEEAKKEAYEEARVKLMTELKSRELDMKQERQDVEVEKIRQETKKVVEEAVAKAIESIYSATQAGAQIMSMPGVAKAADQVLNSAGFEDKDLAPIVATPGPITVPQMNKNTSPMFPGRPQRATVGMEEGIEAQGVQ